MLYKATDLVGNQLKCRDAEVGAVHELYFDDRYWTIRYLVVDTGPWLGRQVLISPYAVVAVNRKEKNIIVELTKKQVEGSPSADAGKMRSTQNVTGYHIHATDGEIGHVADFVIEEGTWAIRYLIIDTKNWWPGKHVVISPCWIENVNWDESEVFVNLSRDAVKESPEFRQEVMPTRDYEIRLHQHYERQGYWDGQPSANEHH